VLDKAAAHNIVANTENLLTIPISKFFFVEFAAFQRPRTVTAVEALIQRLPLMPYLFEERSAVAVLKSLDDLANTVGVIAT
jgi:hypothetical protein